MHFRFEHDFDIDPKSYWELFLSEEFSKDLFTRLKMKNREVLELKDEGNVYKRVQRMTPDTEVPAFIRSMVSDISYTERNTYYRDRSQMDVVIEPAMMKNKFDMKGLYSVKPLGEGKSRRTFEGDVKVSVMLVGGQIEKYMVDEMKKSYDATAAITREWIDKKKKAQPAPGA